MSYEKAMRQKPHLNVLGCFTYRPAAKVVFEKNNCLKILTKKLKHWINPAI